MFNGQRDTGATQPTALLPFALAERNPHGSKWIITDTRPATQVVDLLSMVDGSRQMLVDRKPEPVSDAVANVKPKAIYGPRDAWQTSKISVYLW